MVCKNLKIIPEENDLDTNLYLIPYLHIYIQSYVCICNFMFVCTNLQIHKCYKHYNRCRCVKSTYLDKYPIVK